jgi:peroxiredoxin Q/BCP
MADTELHIGDEAPDFALPDENGAIVRLSDLRGKRVVVYFYPIDDTPGCTAQACGFRDAYPQIEERNAVVLGISPQDTASHQAFKSKYDLPFKLLVDADHAVASAYGVWNSDVSLPFRSHFIVDETGHLADVQVRIKALDSVQRALESLGV